MRFFLSFAVITASICPFVSAQSNDGLFSEVAMEAVFEKQQNTTAETAEIAENDTLPRITGTDTLVAALKSAGFEATKDAGKASMKLRQGRWMLPLSMAVQVEQDRIVTEVSLAKMQDDSAGNEQLLNLLAAGDAGRGTFFAFDSKSKHIVLRSSLSNRSVTPNQLRKHLQHLGAVAENHADSWSALGKTVTTGTANPATKSLSTLGSWTASLGKDSFAIRLTADSKFQLVHLRNGKSTISKGKVTRSGSLMTLAGDDGSKLSCTVAQTTADQFQLSIAGAKGAATTKLNFKKAK